MVAMADLELAVVVRLEVVDVGEISQKKDERVQYRIFCSRVVVGFNPRLFVLAVSVSA